MNRRESTKKKRASRRVRSSLESDEENEAPSFGSIIRVNSERCAIESRAEES